MKKTTRKGKKRDAEKELEAARLAALVPLPPVHLIDKLFAIDWCLDKDSFIEMTHDIDSFDDNTWKYLVVNITEKANKYDANIPEIKIDTEALLVEKGRLEEESRLIAEAEAKAKEEAEEEARKLAEEELIRKEKEDAKAAKAAKGKKPVPEVKKKPSNPAKEETKNSTTSQETSLLSQALDNMTLDENGNARLLASLTTDNVGTDVGIDGISIPDQLLVIPTDEELAAQLQQQQEKETESSEAKQMKLEEHLIKMLLLEGKFKVAMDLIQNDQRCLILLELLFLQYRFCKQFDLTYEQTRGYIATIYDCIISAVFGVTKPLGITFTTTEDPLSTAYFVALMMEHHINSAKYDILLREISTLATSIVKDKEANNTASPTMGNDVVMMEILLPEYVEKVLAAHYSKTFLQHILAYKYSFKDCKYLKVIPKSPEQIAEENNNNKIKTKKSKSKARSKD